MATFRFDDEAARRLERSYMTPDIVRQREVTLGFLGLKPGEHVVDIGSGPGFLCESMADAVGPKGRVLGLDISDDLLAAASARNKRRELLYAKSDAMALEAPDATFDVAVSTQVYEYVADCDRALREMYRVLKPSGRALVMATDWDGVVWNSSNRARMRAMLTVWEKHCAEPRLPRTLALRMRKAGSNVTGIHGHSIINTRLGDDTYSQGIMEMMANFVRKHSRKTGPQADAWLGDLRGLDRQGEYFFSSTRFIVTATRLVS